MTEQWKYRVRAHHPVDRDCVDILVFRYDLHAGKTQVLRKVHPNNSHEFEWHDTHPFAYFENHDPAVTIDGYTLAKLGHEDGRRLERLLLQLDAEYGSEVS